MKRLLMETGVRQIPSPIFSRTALPLLVLQYLFIACHGLHLSKTISYTALNLANEAGMREEDISAAAMLSGGEEEDEDETVGARQIDQQDDIPPITDSVRLGEPVLPLCCSRDSDDLLYYQCGGSSVSKENLNDNNNGIQRSWEAPGSVLSTKLSMEFRLEKSVLSCHYATFAASISLNENSTDGHHFYPDGNLKFENEFYRINEYCISSIKRDKISLQICQANCSNPLTPCIHKCCQLDEIYSFGSDDFPTGCQPIVRGGTADSTSASEEMGRSIVKWSPHLYHDLSLKLSSDEVSKLTPHYIQRYPSNFKHKCKSKKTTVFPFGMEVADYLTEVTGKTFKNLEFRLRKDGWLLYPFKDRDGKEIPVLSRILNYCVDGAQGYGELTEYRNAETESVLFLCSGGVDEGKKIKKRKRKKHKKTATSIPLIMRTDFARTTSYSNSTGVYTTIATIDDAHSTKVPRYRFDTSSTTMKASSTMTIAPIIKNMTATSTTATIAPVSSSFSPKAPTTFMLTPSSTASTTPIPPTTKTLAQERKVFTLFSSSRNKSFYNKIMSGSGGSNNNTSSSNPISLNEISSTTASSSFTTKKPRFRKRSRHYIFYKPISVHSLLRSNDWQYDDDQFDDTFENSIIIPESEEFATAINRDENTSGVSSSFEEENTSMSLKNETMDQASNVSSVEIYTKSRQKPHILYQLFQFNSHSRPANVVLNHNAKKLTKIKKRKPSVISLFPNHPNRTKIVTRKMIKKPKYQLPVCCNFPTDVNDGQAYHCRNRMVDFAIQEGKLFQNSNITVKPIWNVPGYFMSNGQDTQFSLETNSISCGYGKWQLQGFLHNFQPNMSGSPSQNMEVPIESGITSDGYLKYENEFYRPDEFCVNGLSPRIVEVQFCKSSCKSKAFPCVSKCCGIHESYSLGLESGYRGCSPLSDEEKIHIFHPTFYRNMHTAVKDQNKLTPHFIQNYPPTFQHLCYRGITLAFPFSEYVAKQLNPKSPNDNGPTFKNLQFRFRSDGKLMYTVAKENGSAATAIYDRKEFCVDLVTDYGSEQPLMNHENHTILFICASQPNTQDENYR